MLPEKQPREGFLDGLRFVAAFGVLSFHYGFRGHAEGAYLSLGFPELSSVVRYGYLGVQLFFMISGYVILWSIKDRTPQSFAVHRLIRLYPTFWFCAAFTVLVEHLTHSTRFYPDLPTVLANLTMVPGWFGFPEIDGSYWSLATELQFYIRIGLSVRAFGYQSIGNVLLVSLVTAAVVEFFHSSPFAQCLAYFCIGAACYLLHSEGMKLKYVALLIASLSVALRTCIQEADALGAFYETPLNPMVCASLVALESLLVLSSSWISPMMDRRANVTAIYFGEITYPIYLIHQTAGYCIMNAYFTPGGRWWALGTTTLLMVAVSTVIYFGFDRPVRAKLRRFANLKVAHAMNPNAV